MAKQTINIGTTANDGTGDPLRTAFDKVNSNFTELYNDDAGDVNSIIAGDGISVDTATGDVTITNTITNNNQLINGAGYVDGTGTANYIAKWTDGDTIGNSVIYDDGTNVGIGTASPTVKLDVLGDVKISNSLQVTGATALYSNLQVSDSITTGAIGGSDGSFILKRQSDGLSVGNLSIDTVNSALTLNTAYSFMFFKTEGTERMRIAGGGDISFRDTSANEAFYWDASAARLGIGTTSPDRALHVFDRVAFSNSDDTGSLLFVPSNTTNGIFSRAANDSSTAVDLQFYAGSTPTMRIDSSGNVGIGTTVPDGRLDISLNYSTAWSTTSRANNFLQISNTSTGAGTYSGIELIATGTGNAGAVEIVCIDSGAGSADLAISTRNADVWGERMRLTSNGNVGIGTSSPVRNLSVYGTSSAVMSFHNSATGSLITDGFFIGNDANLAYVYNYEATPIIFGVQGQERMRIDSAGNVGIGTSSPYQKTVIDGHLAFTTGTAGTDYTGDIKRNGIGWQATSGTGGLGAFINAINTPAWGADLTFYTRLNTSGAINERMRITSGGFLKASNTGSYLSSTGSFHENITNVSSSLVTIFQHTSAVAPYGIEIDFSNSSPNNTTNYFIYAQDSTAVRFIVYSNGDVKNTNNSYGAISDIKLKENITDASPKLDDLMQVKIRNYNLIGEETKQLGVVAQELEEVFPSMISESPDTEEQEVTDAEGNVTKETVDLGTTTKSVKYSVFVPMLIKAMQEQQEIINDLKARIETLENK